MGIEINALLEKSLNALKGKWGLPILAFFIYSVLLGGSGIFKTPGSLIALILGGPFTLGAASFSLAFVRGEEVQLSKIFSGFDRFITALGAYLLIIVYVILWTLLLILPGIIAALSYSMTFYILSDTPNIKVVDALERSKQMMEGYKWKLFYLYLHYLLLSVLCLLTLGIGFLWLIPFIHITNANFYEAIKNSGEMEMSGSLDRV